MINLHSYIQAIMNTIEPPKDDFPMITCSNLGNAIIKHNLIDNIHERIQ